jgi:hypothetical protein
MIVCTAAGCGETIGAGLTARAARMLARQSGWTAVTRAPFRCPTHRLEALNAIRASNGLAPKPAEMR